MLEPYSREEEEYIRYLVKKYLPGLVTGKNKNGPSVMFKQDEKLR